MRIGFDVSQTGAGKAGCGYFADGLIRSLAEIDTDNDYVLYPTFGDFFWDPKWRRDTWLGDGHPNMTRGVSQSSIEDMHAFWGNPPDDWETALGDPDIIHTNNFFCPIGLEKAKLVYTLYDLGFLENPEWTTEENRVGCFNGVFNASIHADQVIAISEHSRRHFLEHFPHYPEDRVSVVYPASRFDESSTDKRPTECDVRSGEFWLHVGTIEPRKNLLFLFDVLAEQKQKVGTIAPIVLAGGEGWLMDDLDREIASRGLKDDVIQLGYVSDEEVAWLYRNCIALLFPSHFEGFGMPILEAMSLGAVPIACQSSSIPEITEGAGVLVPSGDRDAFQTSMIEMVSNRETRKQRKKHCVKRAGEFSWRKSATQLLAIYNDLAGTTADNRRARNTV